MEGALEEKLEGDIEDLGKDRRQLKSAISRQKRRGKDLLLKNKLKGGKQDCYTV